MYHISGFPGTCTYLEYNNEIFRKLWLQVTSMLSGTFVVKITLSQQLIFRSWVGLPMLGLKAKYPKVTEGIQIKMIFR
jgi:hypothetical protein